ncbi:endo-1,6-alpha-mannosidase [Crepidotus variabilis]|uniref:Endo-1,6-alpha-mannosidase n=1 Tax=Crepidotus variabilis TaxID=179855 RepID=A0A9P6EAR9_9AGAR|nr:endo-1,6-alpha-mannosidase [Crepidotus variabilis]
MSTKSLRSLIVVGLVACVALAQDLGVPTSWRKFSNSRPLPERVSIAQNGINGILPQLNTGNAQFNGIGYWQSANVYSAMANQDYHAKTATNKANVINNLNKAFSLYSNYDQFGWVLESTSTLENMTDPPYIVDFWWATSALYAYRAYKDNNMLSHAVATWNRVNAFVITTSNAGSGSMSGKNFRLKGSCDGQTMAGAVFWRPTSDDMGVNSITTGLFITLSAYLAELTGDAKYKDAAILSATWIQNHNIANNLILDSVNAQTCNKSPASFTFTYNSGKYIEGLSVLSSITGDSKWTNLMLNIIATAVKASLWQGSDGIITEGASLNSNNDGVGFKAIFIRGILEAFSRSSNSNLRTLIHSYVDVQYNALLDLAASGNNYSSNWHGPAQGFTTWGQLAALDVLVAAVVAN